MGINFSTTKMKGLLTFARLAKSNLPFPQSKILHTPLELRIIDW